MELSHLELPGRSVKPRRTGLTVAIDTGVPLGYFTDLVSSAGEYLDFVKFGWGTSVVARDMKKKLAVLKGEGVSFYLGGTLFEKYILQDRFDQFREFCEGYGCEYVEVSNGTIDLADEEKSRYVAKLSNDFKVISEVGSKVEARSKSMTPTQWIACIRRDLDAGAVLVTLETRGSGRGGICRPNGELRCGLIEEILASGLGGEGLLFEAPNTELQGYFIRLVGSDVNLANIAVSDLVGLETIRLGLRSETLIHFETCCAPWECPGP
jgi:phosphosulfolactate synthase